MYFRRKVQHGEKLGRKLGFPTLNFNLGNFGDHYEPGVYSCTLKFKRGAKSGEPRAKRGKNLHAHHATLITYAGALYFGPKGKGRNVLEIHMLNFSEQIYSQFISFKVGKKIRGPKKFESLEALKEGIAKDVAEIKALK